jgi:glutamyl-tRNA reductase
VLGAGKTAEAAAMQMSERGLKDLTIANRTFEHAHQVACAVGAKEASLHELDSLLREADVLVCATAGQEFVITAPMVEQAMSERADKPIMLLDVSVPRNIDPAVGTIAGVHLYSLEDLSQLAEENRLQREAQTMAVQRLIDEEIATWHGLRQSSDSGRLVAALHRRMDKVRREYVERNSHHFAESEQPQLEVFSAGLTRNLFHELVENLRGLDIGTAEGKRRYEVARELLNMDGDEKK